MVCFLFKLHLANTYWLSMLLVQDEHFQVPVLGKNDVYRERENLLLISIK